MTTKMIRRKWVPLAILCAFGLVSLAGCGSKRLPVSGTITLDDKPLNVGILVFSPDSSKGNTARINCTSPVREGRYELRTNTIIASESGAGVPPGWYKVTLETPDRGTRRRPQARVEINPKFQSVETTPLEVEVKDNPEPGAYDFKLTK